MSQRNMFYIGVVVLFALCVWCNKKDLNLCIGLAVVAVAAIHFGGQCFAPVKKVDTSESFVNSQEYQKEQKMGPYDGMVLKGAQDNWRLMKDQPMNRPEDIYTLYGTPTGLEDKKSVYDPDRNNYPSVDGTEGAPKSMFALAFNKISPACCPSTYSTDTGCVCTTSQQRKYFNQRGGNRKGSVTEF